MRFHELTIVPEDKDKPIKMVYEDDIGIIKANDYTIELTRKLTPVEAEKLLEDMFGTTNVGILDCSYMSDEELNQIVDKWNNIPN